MLAAVREALRTAWEISDPTLLAARISREQAELESELAEANQTPRIYGLGYYFQNVGDLIRDASHKVMRDEQASATAK